MSFIYKLLKQYRTTGEIAPKPFNGGVKLKLSPDNLLALAELIEKNNDATLEELCQMVNEKLGINISRATMGRMTQGVAVDRKKKLYIRLTKALAACKKQNEAMLTHLTLPKARHWTRMRPQN